MSSSFVVTRGDPVTMTRYSSRTRDIELSLALDPQHRRIVKFELSHR